MINLVCLNFAPAHINHLIAYAKCLKKEKIKFLLANKFDLFEEEILDLGNIEYIDNKIDINKEVYIYFSPSEKNYRIAERVHKAGGKNIYLYHEPWRGYLNYMNEMGTIMNKLKVVPIHFFQTLMLKKSDLIILPSNHAVKLFNRYENKANKYHYKKIDLLVNDYYEKGLPSSKRKYFSYIGTIAFTHAFDKYIDFVCDNYKKVEFKFLIATRSKINSESMAKLMPVIQANKIIIYDGKVLSNEVMNKCYLESFACWTAYKTTTQSGVIPMSYMNGTPVVATHHGSFEDYVISSRTGEYVNENYDNLLEVTTQMFSNNDKYVKSTRKFFLKNFYYKSAEEKIYEIIGELNL